MSVSKLKGFRSAGLSCLLFLCTGNVMAKFALNMTKGVTAISEESYSLHMKALWMVTAIGLIVFGIMIWSLIHHRKSRGVNPARFHHSAILEIIWTSIPILILVGIAFPATKALIALEHTADTEMTIKIRGYQGTYRGQCAELCGRDAVGRGDEAGPAASGGRRGSGMGAMINGW